jgi:hypothetical protein
MRNPLRIRFVLQALRELWEVVPDWRFGQLMCNLQKMEGNDLFYMEDDDFMDLVDKVKEELKNA